MTVKALLALIACIALVGSAEAQPVPGGLPDVEARVTVLETTTNTLQSQVSALQAQVATLQSQVITLQNSNSSLQSALNAEIANRQNGDSVLQPAFSQEIAARKTADTALQAAFAASSAGFSTYNNEAELVEGAEATVGTIGPLPAGSYAVVATASVLNTKHNADWDCILVRDDTNAIIGRTFAGTESASLSDLGTHGTSNGNVTIPALATLPDNGRMHMTCETGVAGSSVFKIQIVATSVGTATVACPDLLACQ